MKKVLLLFGGNSFEHEVSNLSAKAIMENIDKSRHDLRCVEITHNNLWLENNVEIDNIIEYIKQFDVLFPIIHGKNGEDGTLQGMLDLFDIKYIGSKCGPSYICMDKERTKQVLHFLNIPQIKFQIYNESEKLELNYPVIIKPSSGGSSIGINKANNEEELNYAINEALKCDNKVIIEQFVKMRELECAVIEDNDKLIMNIGEIIPSNEFYDFDAKYNNESETYTSPNIPEEIDKSIKEYSKIIFRKFQLSGLARIDFFYDEINSKIFVNEINTIPGFTKISMFPKLIMDKGYEFNEIINILIDGTK